MTTMSAQKSPQFCHRTKLSRTSIFWQRQKTDLHMFSQRAGVCVGLYTLFAQIGLVRRVNVQVFLAVTAVGEASVAAEEITHERFLPWRRTEGGD